VSEIVMSR